MQGIHTSSINAPIPMCRTVTGHFSSLIAIFATVAGGECKNSENNKSAAGRFGKIPHMVGNGEKFWAVICRLIGGLLFATILTACGGGGGGVAPPPPPDGMRDSLSFDISSADTRFMLSDTGKVADLDIKGGLNVGVDFVDGDDLNGIFEIDEDNDTLNLIATHTEPKEYDIRIRATSDTDNDIDRTLTVLVADDIAADVVIWEPEIPAGEPGEIARITPSGGFGALTPELTNGSDDFFMLETFNGGDIGVQLTVEVTTAMILEASVKIDDTHDDIAATMVMPRINVLNPPDPLTLNFANPRERVGIPSYPGGEFKVADLVMTDGTPPYRYRIDPPHPLLSIPSEVAGESGNELWITVSWDTDAQLITVTIVGDDDSNWTDSASKEIVVLVADHVSFDFYALPSGSKTRFASGETGLVTLIEAHGGYGDIDGPNIIEGNDYFDIVRSGIFSYKAVRLTAEINTAMTLTVRAQATDDSPLTDDARWSQRITIDAPTTNLQLDLNNLKTRFNLGEYGTVASLSASLGSGSGYTYSLINNAPDAFLINASNELRLNTIYNEDSGGAQLFTLTVQVTDDASGTKKRRITILVADDLSMVRDTGWRDHRGQLGPVTHVAARGYNPPFTIDGIDISGGYTVDGKDVVPTFIEGGEYFGYNKSLFSKLLLLTAVVDTSATLTARLVADDGFADTGSATLEYKVTVTVAPLTFEFANAKERFYRGETGKVADLAIGGGGGSYVADLEDDANALTVHSNGELRLVTPQKEARLLTATVMVDDEDDSTAAVSQSLTVLIADDIEIILLTVRTHFDYNERGGVADFVAEGGFGNLTYTLIHGSENFSLIKVPSSPFGLINLATTFPGDTTVTVSLQVDDDNQPATAPALLGITISIATTNAFTLALTNVVDYWTLGATGTVADIIAGGGIPSYTYSVSGDFANAFTVISDFDGDTHLHLATPPPDSALFNLTVHATDRSGGNNASVTQPLTVLVADPISAEAIDAIYYITLNTATPLDIARLSITGGHGGYTANVIAQVCDDGQPCNYLSYDSASGVLQLDNAPSTTTNVFITISVSDGYGDTADAVWNHHLQIGGIEPTDTGFDHLPTLIAQFSVSAVDATTMNMPAYVAERTRNWGIDATNAGWAHWAKCMASCAGIDESEYLRGSGATIAIVDTGMDITHTDLQDNIALPDAERPVLRQSRNRAEGNSGILTRNGFTVSGGSEVRYTVAIAYGEDAATFYVQSGKTITLIAPDGVRTEIIGTANGVPSYTLTTGIRNNLFGPRDRNGALHATHVAGIAAGQLNAGDAADAGIVGVAPDAKILPLTYLSGSNNLNLEQAYTYAEANGAFVANNSWGWVPGWVQISISEPLTSGNTTYQNEKIWVELPRAYRFSRQGGQQGSISVSVPNDSAAREIEDHTEDMLIVFARGNTGWNSQTGLVEFCKDYGFACATSPDGAIELANYDLATLTVYGYSSGYSEVVAPNPVTISTFNENFGNSTGDTPAHLPNYDSATRWLNVVAVDASTVIAYFSDGCGISKDYCLAAPGVTISSSVPGDGENTDLQQASGTSMAAPHVSGLAALLKGAFPNLTAEQARDIILFSATGLGTCATVALSTYCTDDTYGHGMMNVRNAFTPFSDLVASGGSNANGISGTSLRDSHIGLSPVFADAPWQITTFNIGAIDEYGRVFQTQGNLQDGILVATPNFDADGNISGVNPHAVITPPLTHATTRPDNIYYDRLFQTALGHYQTFVHHSDSLAFARQRYGDYASYQTAYQFNDAQSFAWQHHLGSAADIPSEERLHAFYKPSFVSEERNNLQWTHKGENIGAAVLVESGESSQHLATRLSYDMDGLAVFAESGLVEEADSVLGATYTGIYETKQAATRYERLGVTYQSGLGDDDASGADGGGLQFYADYLRARTRADETGGIVQSYASASDSLTSGLSYGGWDLSWSRPLAVTGGSWRWQYVDGYAADGGYSVATNDINLSAANREEIFSLRYSGDSHYRQNHLRYSIGLDYIGNASSKHYTGDTLSLSTALRLRF